MYILAFVTAVVCSLVLQRQTERHAMEKRREYMRSGRPVPLTPPRVTVIGAWIHIVLGLFLLMIGVIFLYIYFSVQQVRDILAGSLELNSVILASGVALIILGFVALAQNRAYHRKPGLSVTP